jgi:hypothetical protein
MLMLDFGFWLFDVKTDVAKNFFECMFLKKF